MPILEASNLTLHYRTERGIVRAVDNVSFAMNEGEALGVVGESGCGKTSLAISIMRLLPPNVAAYSGSLVFDGSDITHFSDEEFRQKIRWKNISMVFQGAMNSLNPVLKAGFQVAEPLVEEGGERTRAYDEANRLLGLVGLPRDVFRRYPHELSGGMKQRVVIAMALVLKPKLLILDEPTSALDVSVQAQIMNLLKRLKRELGLSVLFITHDIALASDICDRFAVLYAGEIVEIGGADDILLNPKHPYTEKLLASTPRLRSDVQPEYIRGAPPDLAQPPVGCRFHPRCPYVFDLCTTYPPMFKVGEGHETKCWLHREKS